MAFIFLFIIGLLVGSFLNVCIDRLPTEESIVVGRSHCDYCKKTLRWYELFPLISYLLQRGRCTRCHKKLSIQYPIIELCTGVGFAALFFYYGTPLFPYVSLVGLFSALVVIFVADLKYQIIPDSMIGMGIVGVFGVVGVHGILMHLVPALLSFLFFYLLWLVTHGRGMGFGDVKFAFLMGLFLGYPGVVVAFYIAFLTGAIVGVILMVIGKKKLKSSIAFGPFLVLGMVIAWVWKDYFLTLWRMFL